MIKPVRMLGVGLLLVALLILLAWLSRTQLLTWGIGQAVKIYGISNLSLRLEQIDTTVARISDLSFDLKAGSKACEIRSSGITITYQPGKISDGEFDTLEVGELAISITSGQTSDSTDTDLELMLASAAAMMSQPVPAKHIRIDELTFFLDAESLVSQSPIALDYTTEGAIRTLHASQDNTQLLLQIEEDLLTFTLNSKDAQEVIAGNFTLGGEGSKVDSVSGKLKLDIAGARKLIEPLLVPSVLKLTGSTTLDLKARKNQHFWEVDIHGAIDSISSEGYSLDQGELTLNLKMPNLLESGPIGFNPGSILKINRIDGDGMTIRNMEIRPVGEYHLNEAHFAGHPEFPLNITFDSLSLKQLALSGLSAQLYADINRLDSDLSISIATRSAIELSALEYGEIELDSPRLELHGPANLVVEDNGRFEFNAENLAAENASIATEVMEINSGPVKAIIRNATNDSVSLGFEVTTPDIRIGDISQEFQFVSGELEQQPSHWTTTGMLELAGLPSGFQYSIQQRSGILDYSIEQQEILDIGNYADAINGIISNWDSGITFESGEMQLQLAGHLNADGTLKNRIVTNLSYVNGKYEELAISDLNLNGPVFYPPAQDSDSATINIGALEYGVMFENIESEWRLKEMPSGELPGLEVFKLDGEFMGSNLESSSFSFDPNLDSNTVQLSVGDLDLNNLMALLEIDGLDVSGKIDGELPIEFSPDGISVNHGEFWNQPDGGTIRYVLDPAQITALANPLTETAIRALEEFNYSVLNAATNYSPSGDLNVNFHIEGTSPNIDNDRQVHLNINTEQNVLSLIKSMNYAGDLNEELDRKIRSSLDKNSSKLQ